jgi:hypothetical protein
MIDPTVFEGLCDLWRRGARRSNRKGVSWGREGETFWVGSTYAITLLRSRGVIIA